MVTNLLTASNQWQNRPADERFVTLIDLKNAVQDRKNVSFEGIVETQNLKVVPTPVLGSDRGQDSISLDFVVSAQSNDYDNRNLDMTHWAFGQISNLAGAPASYLRTLSPELVSQNLNHTLPKTRETAKLLLTVNGRTKVRAFTSESYGRIWDIDVVNAVERLCERNPNWHNPPAYKRNTNRPIPDTDRGTELVPVQTGMENLVLSEVEAAGLYASDRDIFMFLVDEDHRIEVGNESLSRGFFVWNSEVGKSSFGLMTFLYRYVCGNHIVWGAQEVREIRIRHSLNAPSKAFSEIMPVLNRYVESSASYEEQTIRKAIECHPANDKEGVINWLQKNGFTRVVSERAYEYAVTEEGNGTSLWNIVQGLSAMARDRKHVDARVDLERQAGKLLNSVNMC